VILFAVILAGLAYPDGAPWGHAGAPEGDNCTACHWDHAAEVASPRLAIDGLPDHYAPGVRYELTVRLVDAGPVNGFQLVASEGAFASVSPTTQSQDNAVRSTAPAGAWRVDWISPAHAAPVHFWLAVNDANGDASEFGDRILLREFESRP
jgi:hypothetical protein